MTMATARAGASRSRWTLGALMGGALLAAACTAATSPGASPAASISGAASDGGNAAAINACTLLTPGEIQQALGVDVKAGVLQPASDPSTCEWDSQDDSAAVGVSLAVGTYDDVLWKQLSSAQQATAVHGVGEAAFKGYPHAGDISIKQGGHEIDLGIVDFTADQQKVDDADMTLAKLVLSRL